MEWKQIRVDNVEAGGSSVGGGSGGDSTHRTASGGQGSGGQLQDAGVVGGTRNPKKHLRICRQCMFPRLYGKFQLIRHKINVHGRYSWHQKKIGLIPLFVCPVCSKGFSWMTSRDAHIKTHGCRKVALHKQLKRKRSE